METPNDDTLAAQQLREEAVEAVRILGGYFGGPEVCKEAICKMVDEKLHINNRIFGLEA